MLLPSQTASGHGTGIPSPTISFASAIRVSLENATLGYQGPLCDVDAGCPTFWHLWATLEEEELPWATH